MSAGDQDENQHSEAAINRLWAVVATVFIVLLFQGLPLLGDESQIETATIQDVVWAWTNRQNSLRAVRVAWTEQRTDRQGSNNKFARLLPLIDKPVDIPPADVTSEAVCTLLVAERNCRYTYQGSVWHLQLGKLIPRDYTSVFDGSNFTELQPKVGAEQYPQAVSKSSNNNLQLEMLDMLPLAWFFWPLRSDCGGIDANAVELDGADPEGFNYLRLIERSKKASSRSWWEYWIESRGEFLVKRAYLNDSNAIPKWGYTLEYSEEGSGISLSDWNIQKLSKGVVDRLYICKLTEVTRNPVVNKDDFEIKLPPGTVLFENNGITGRPALVGKDGSVSEIHVQPSSYSDLVAAAKADRNLNSSSSRWLLVFANLAFLCTVAIVMTRRGRAKKEGENNGDEPSTVTTLNP